MTMQHLPRPWMLAALTDVPVAALARNGRRNRTRTGASMPRPARARRRRLSARRGTRRGCHAWYGEDAWGGAERWRDVEAA